MRLYKVVPFAIIAIALLAAFSAVVVFVSMGKHKPPASSTDEQVAKFQDVGSINMQEPVASVLERVILPSLVKLNLDQIDGEVCSAAALMGAIGQHESRYQTFHQVNGPALSWWQIEPATYLDLLTTPNAMDILNPFAQKSANLNMNPLTELEYNPWYAAAVARLVIARKGAPIPAQYIHLVAAWWKLHWNTPAGAGTVEEFIENVTPVWDEIVTAGNYCWKPVPYSQYLRNAR